MRKRGKRFERNVCGVNPMFALNAECRNALAVPERRAMDALLEHRATDDDIECIETLIEASIRAVRISIETSSHLVHAQLETALAALYSAALGLRNSKARKAAVGVYGLDAADREALIALDGLVMQMRKPGVILRKTWLAAFRGAMSKQGVVIPKQEQSQ